MKHSRLDGHRYFNIRKCFRRHECILNGIKHKTSKYSLHIGQLTAVSVYVNERLKYKTQKKRKKYYVKCAFRYSLDPLRTVLLLNHRTQSIAIWIRFAIFASTVQIYCCQASRSTIPQIGRFEHFANDLFECIFNAFAGFCRRLQE